MGLLTLVGLVMFSVAVINGAAIFSNKIGDEALRRHRLGYIKSIGLFALITGFLGQLIGLYSAFEYMANVDSVSSDILAGGLKVSSITSLYGMLIFLISYLVWFFLEGALNRSVK